MEKHYVVVWTIDVWASDPIDAARQSQETQQETGNDWFFDVTDDDGVTTKVDLEFENTPEEILEEGVKT